MLDFPAPTGLVEEKQVNRVSAPVARPIPHLEIYPLACGRVGHARHRGARSLAQDLVVVPYARQEQATLSQFGSYVVRRQQEIFVVQKVRQRVVAGDHHVELAAHLLAQGAKVRHPESYRDTKRLGFLAGSPDRVGAQIGGGHFVTEQRQTYRLRPDTGGAVQYGKRPAAHLPANQPIQHLTLTANSASPVGVDEVVAVGQVIVESRRRVDQCPPLEVLEPRGRNTNERNADYARKAECGGIEPPRP